ncbi:MAG: transporter ATP-binding protein, partial [Frankiales bacterium]|nr:transporter ATP-binding protein [Frankiales bacterium]
MTPHAELEPALTASVDVTLGVFRLTVTLVAGPGEVIAVTGPNGAGKTTLLRALAGALRGGPATVGRRVGYVPAGGFLLPHLSARDNVALVLRAHGERPGAARRRGDAALASVGADPYAGLRGSALSAGQGQRVALARALVGAPDLLLLDEPFAAVAVEDRAALRALV